MKKLLLGLSLVAIPICLHATDATIVLGQNFLKNDGIYKFTLDVKAKPINKEWTVTVSDGKATVDRAAGLKGKGISISGNVITVKIGVIKQKKANDLKVIALTGPFAGQSGSLGIRKASKTFTVDIGPGFTLGYTENKEPEKDRRPDYELSMGSLVPDGAYTLKLKRRAGEDKTFNFSVTNHQIDKITGSTEGKLLNGLLQIDAGKMCLTKRAKKGAAIAGGTAAAVLGTIALGAAAYKVLPKILGQATKEVTQAQQAIIKELPKAQQGIRREVLHIQQYLTVPVAQKAQEMSFTTASVFDNILVHATDIAKQTTALYDPTALTGMRSGISAGAKLLAGVSDETAKQIALIAPKITSDAGKAALTSAKEITATVSQVAPAAAAVATKVAANAAPTLARLGLDPKTIAIIGAMAIGGTAGAIGNAGAAVLGYKQATGQLTCNEGPAAYKGKSASIGFEICRNNKWELDAVEQMILVNRGLGEAAEPEADGDEEDINEGDEPLDEEIAELPKAPLGVKMTIIKFDQSFRDANIEKGTYVISFISKKDAEKKRMEFTIDENGEFAPLSGFTGIKTRFERKSRVSAGGHVLGLYGTGCYEHLTINAIDGSLTGAEAKSKAKTRLLDRCAKERTFTVSVINGQMTLKEKD